MQRHAADPPGGTVLPATATAVASTAAGAGLVFLAWLLLAA